MAQPAVIFDQVEYTYNARTAFSYRALKKTSTRIRNGSLTAITGHTGSGKSTFTKLIDGLLLPSSGSIQVGPLTLSANTDHSVLRKLHQYVGYVFQFPEKQLFSDTVIQDVEFGPLNLGQSAVDAKQAAVEALSMMHVPQSLFKHSPFELSGGQMRRVAIAGVLATHPHILIMDEPTAGLDPQGQSEIFRLMQSLNQQGVTIIWVSHRMEQVAAYASDVLVLNDGHLLFNGDPHELFEQEDQMQVAGLEAPQATIFAQELAKQGLKLDRLPLTVADLSAAIADKLKEGRHE